MDLGKRLRKYREDKNLTMEEVSKRLGVTKQTLYKYETGIITNIPLERIEQLGRIYNVLPAVIMGWEKEAGDDMKILEYPFIPDPVAAGIPQTISGYQKLPTIPVPKILLGKYADRQDLLILRVNGESMNKIIPNGSYIGIITDINVNNLKDGDLVVFSDDYEYSLKHYYDLGDEILFRPNSTDKSFADLKIKKTESLKIEGRVVMYNVKLD